MRCHEGNLLAVVFLMLPVLILQTGNPPHSVGATYGGFDQMVCSVSGLAPGRIAVIKAYKGERPLGPAHYGAALITGSRANITDRAPWSEACAGWVRDAMDVSLPLFGICYGHQLMADALGGRVDYHPQGREVGTHRVALTKAGKADAALAGMPDVFAAHFIHEQSVIEAPQGASVLASNPHDPNQMLRFAPNALSVQFHPEFTAPIMRAYFDVMESFLTTEGLDVATLRQQVTETPAPHALMQRFFRERGLL